MQESQKSRGMGQGCCGGFDGCESATPPPAWSYSGANGPEHWGDLDPRFSPAKVGRQQSPIDLTGPFQSGAETVFYTYQASPLSVTNNGHSIQIDLPPGSSINVGGRRYELLQYHFHTPSEHTTDGGFYEMEMHLVHQNEAGQFTVVGVYFTTGEFHPALGQVWQHMPERAGETITSDMMVDPSDFLPSARRCVQYDGSLTTPPCTEGVAWIMMLDPIQVSAEQIAQFERIIGVSNRPVQPLNGRTLRFG